jgi:hypothetical protein
MDFELRGLYGIFENPISLPASGERELFVSPLEGRVVRW